MDCKSQRDIGYSEFNTTLIVLYGHHQVLQFYKTLRRTLTATEKSTIEYRSLQ
jgi:hypothetical protein